MLKDKIVQDMHTALKSGDKVKAQTLRLLISASQYVGYAKNKKIETDEDIISVIAKEVKQRDESIEAYKAGNRPDLLAVEEAEKAILLTYLPKQLSTEEITEVAKRIIANVGATTLKDKGKVMSATIAELKGKANGSEINKVVTNILQGTNEN